MTNAFLASAYGVLGVAGTLLGFWISTLGFFRPPLQTLGFCVAGAAVALGAAGVCAYLLTVALIGPMP